MPAIEAAIAASEQKLKAGILDEAFRQAQAAERAAIEAELILEGTMKIETNGAPINADGTIGAGAEGEVNVETDGNVDLNGTVNLNLEGTGLLNR